MKEVLTKDAAGMILCHDLTRIVPGEYAGPAFKKGHVIAEEDIEPLLKMGKEHLYVWEPKDGYLHEDDAAIRLKDLAVGKGIAYGEIREGKITFSAEYDGLLKVDREALFQLNMIDELTMALIQNNTPVKKGEKLGGTRVVPLMIDEKKIIEAEQKTKGPILEILPFQTKKTAIINTGSEIYSGKIKDKFGPVIREKVEEYGCPVIGQTVLPDDSEQIKQAILNYVDQGAEMVLCTGGMSVDPDDLTPTAIISTGGNIVTYGSPVLPGAMFLLAYLGDIPIMGLPGCVMHSRRTVMDLVLPRILTGEKLTKADIAAYGHGGFCLRCEECVFPHCSFGKY